MLSLFSHAYLCSLCRKKFPVEDIRYGKDGKSILCINCYDKSVEKEELLKKKMALREERHKEEETILKIICAKCRYKFTYNRGSRVRLMCPYCGGNNLMRDDITAEKLVEEVSRTTRQRRVA